MADLKQFNLPDLGEGLTEAELITWHVRPGDTVALNQIIAEVETAKAAVEMPSPYSGTVVTLHHEPGTTIEVGAPFITVDCGGEGSAPAPAEAPAPAAEPVPERESVLVGYGAKTTTSNRRRPRKDAPARTGAPTTAAPASPAPVPASPAPAAAPAAAVATGRPAAKPPVRKLAKDLDIDLRTVIGTGPQGTITRQDLLAATSATPAAATAPAPAAAAPAYDTTREERIPIKGVRKLTAEAMVSSAFTAPHVTEFITVDVTPTMELLAELKESKAFAGVKLTPLALIAKALLLALRRNPTLNSRWDEANQEIVLPRYVNLGIAAATPRGLVVPNIKDADRLSLVELASALGELTVTAKEGKTPPADMTGGTITITNVGVFGVDTGTPIINPGEAAILCLGAIRKQPWVHNDELAIRQVTTFSLSFDHRLVDGEQGSRFLADLAAILSDTRNLIAFS
ncbi:pyruvate dehydrogenase E2 component (dihydrolipoamide acetyltransferase) [Crossiella equi]|uniref:Dihydrolipoamide acetyltransferase component of pyruvate dehydrogenase complex n=1 Tax=Crossiella equi TaxID=130796 RepID=A0ABS5AMN8_9PSEU|nr:dihydrolipoamide acetyltransferase family protein [Crossiella equi]MBP2477839.1 pyruvate dehydrogenase E2 component (dihydrolipoamide acetyltransferase) [Crossiella equi]